MSAAKPHTPMLPLETRLLVADDAQVCPVTAALLREAAQAGLAAQKFSHIGQRKLDDLRKNGWVVNGVAIHRTIEDGSVVRGLVTYEGLVRWIWNEQHTNTDDDLYIAAAELARQQHGRILELEAEVERFRADAMNEKAARQTLESEAVGFQAELAGYEASIGHLSALVDELRAAVASEREACAQIVFQHTGIPPDAIRRGTGVRDRIVILGEHIMSDIRAKGQQ